MRQEPKPAGSLRVLLVDESVGRAAILEQALADAGHAVVGRIAASEDLQAAVQRIEPDVIIIDMDSPDRDTLEHMRGISADRPKPIVMFAEDGDSATIEEAVRAGVSAYVVDGLNPGRVKPIMEVAIARFREFQALRQELADARHSLAERKDIERAKGILMQQRNWTEDEAYQALRKLAMDRNLRLAEVARNIIAVADLL
ncbi:MAG: ANTAR domain-containing protein [Gammaproteobacteria bacterium]|nr:ANTAR domain-containing protein [Gammaproteobacteria bacterium]